MKVRKVITFKTYFVFSRAQLCSGLEKAGGLSALLTLIFARFEFDSAIYCNFGSS